MRNSAQGVFLLSAASLVGFCRALQERWALALAKKAFSTTVGSSASTGMARGRPVSMAASAGFIIFLGLMGWKLMVPYLAEAMISFSLSKVRGLVAPKARGLCCTAPGLYPREM